MIFLFEITRKLEMKNQYLIPALFIATMSISLIFMIREPTIKEHRTLADGTREDQVFDRSRPRWEQFKKLTFDVFTEVSAHPKYVLVFICVLVSRLMNILFAVYIQLWVLSFQKVGVLESKEEANKTYRNIVIWMQLATLLIAPLFAYNIDGADLRFIIPLAFFVRGSVALSFRSVDHPQSWNAYFLAIAITVTSVI